MPEFLQVTRYKFASFLSRKLGEGIYSACGLALARQRVRQQQLRNRIMEALDTLADGSDAFRAYGVKQYFEDILKLMPDPTGLSVLTEAEQLGLKELQRISQQGYHETEEAGDDRTGERWAETIAPQAEQLLKMFKRRGFFREDAPEVEPTAAPYL